MKRFEVIKDTNKNIVTKTCKGPFISENTISCLKAEIVFYKSLMFTNLLIPLIDVSLDSDNKSFTMQYKENQLFNELDLFVLLSIGYMKNFSKYAIHGDIKPENIIYKENSYFYLIDFEGAQILGESKNNIFLPIFSSYKSERFLGDIKEDMVSMSRVWITHLENGKSTNKHKEIISLCKKIERGDFSDWESIEAEWLTRK